MPPRLALEHLGNLRGEKLNQALGLMMDLHRSDRTEKWLNYRPLPKLRKFHQSQAQLRGLIGGNRSGKTTAGMMEAIWYAKGTHPFRTVLAPNSGWIVALDNEVLGDVILPKLFEYLNESDIKSFNRVKGYLELRNGSVIKFKSCDSGPMKFQSAERRWIWFDEEPPYEVWRECLVRAGAKYSLDIWLTMTPLEGMDWTYDELVMKQRPGKLEVFGAALIDNYHLLKSERDRLVEEFKDSPEASARLYGEYFQKSGLIYPGLDESIHLVDPFPIPSDWPYCRIIDPHPRKPSAAIWGAISPKVVGGKNVKYITDELNDQHEVLFSEWAQRCKEIDGRKNIVRSLIDPSSRQANNISGLSLVDHLAELGLPSDFANNDKVWGYNAVREHLSGPEGPALYIFKTCWKTWRQLTHLIYDEWRFRGATRDVKEEQRKKDDDLADCVRYFLAEGMVYEDRLSAERLRPPPRSLVTGY